MKIADYQMHNVLKDFTQQLRRRVGAPGQGPPARGRRRSGQLAVIRQLLTTIVDRMGRLNPEAGSGAPPAPGRGEPASRGEFTYRLQRPSGECLTRRLEIEDSRHLVQRFHDLAGEEDTGQDAP